MDTLEKFLDEDGRLKSWPRRKEDKRAVLVYLAGKFEAGRTYTEAEVNEIILEWHLFDDHALLRRELFDAFLLDRSPDCREYRLSPKPGDGA